MCSAVSRVTDAVSRFLRNGGVPEPSAGRADAGSAGHAHPCVFEDDLAPDGRATSSYSYSEEHLTAGHHRADGPETGLSRIPALTDPRLPPLVCCRDPGRSASNSTSAAPTDLVDNGDGRRPGDAPLAFAPITAGVDWFPVGQPAAGRWNSARQRRGHGLCGSVRSSMLTGSRPSLARAIDLGPAQRIQGSRHLEAEMLIEPTPQARRNLLKTSARSLVTCAQEPPDNSLTRQHDQGERFERRPACGDGASVPSVPEIRLNRTDNGTRNVTGLP
jgi:hypothetical protein